MSKPHPQDVLRMLLQLDAAARAKVFATSMLEFMGERGAPFMLMQVGGPEVPDVTIALAMSDYGKALVLVAEEMKKTCGHWAEGKSDGSGQFKLEEMCPPRKAPEAAPPQGGNTPPYDGVNVAPDLDKACQDMLAYLIREDGICLTKTAYNAATGQPVGAVIAVRGKDDGLKLLRIVQAAMKEMNLYGGRKGRAKITQGWADTVVLCRQSGALGWKIQGKRQDTPANEPTQVLAEALERKELLNMLKDGGYEASGAQARVANLDDQIVIFERK